MTLLHLGALLRERRGSRGIREVAKEIGVSSATLSRVEGGRLPDLMTFRRICSWLRVDPAVMLGIPGTQVQQQSEAGIENRVSAAAHLRAGTELTPDAARDLAALIFAAQRELARRVMDGRADVPTWI